MIKDVFVFSKNSWHMKLMTWTWGYHPHNFRNMCPYFWLSVLNVLISPFTALLKAIRFVVVILAGVANKLFKDYEKYCDEQAEIWMNKKSVEVRDYLTQGKYHPLMSDLYKRTEKPHSYYEKLEKLFDMIAEYDGNNWELYKTRKEQLQDLYWSHKKTTETKVKVKLYTGRIESSKPKFKIKTNEQIIGKMVVYIKYVATAIGGLAIGTGAYWLIKGLVWAFKHIAWASVGHWTLFIIGGLIAIAIMGVVVYFILKSFVALWCRYGKYCIPCSSRREKMFNFVGNIFTKIFNVIAYPFILLANGILNVCHFFGSVWDFIIAMKNNNCPAIRWEEDGPDPDDING